MKTTTVNLSDLIRPPSADLSVRGADLAAELRRNVWIIHRAGVARTMHTRHAHATETEIKFHLWRVMQSSPGAVCLNTLPLHVAEWLLDNLNT